MIINNILIAFCLVCFFLRDSIFQALQTSAHIASVMTQIGFDTILVTMLVCAILALFQTLCVLLGSAIALGHLTGLRMASDATTDGPKVAFYNLSNREADTKDDNGSR